ncbi:hypothetical protein ANO11243_035280 [Dothideomycetidae sp. 11243]|nr:hypothetical protein ANO11243_035280 [fungal sp. No.11243]
MRCAEDVDKVLLLRQMEEYVAMDDDLREHAKVVDLKKWLEEQE